MIMMILTRNAAERLLKISKQSSAVTPKYIRREVEGNAVDLGSKKKRGGGGETPPLF